MTRQPSEFRFRPPRKGGGLYSVLVAATLSAPAIASAQIDTGIMEKHKAALEKQITDPDQKREGGTQPRDWDYQLP